MFFMADDSSKPRTLETKVLETWATLDYRADKWGPERIVFDAVSNHFSEDCGGTNFWITFHQDEKQVDFRNYDSTKPVEKIYFCDDGQGYHYIYTVLHHSNKMDRETQTGKFGEGLKMISAAALRHNVNLVFRSQNWSVQPRMKKIRLPQEKKEAFLLCQEVTIGHEAKPGSYTCIYNPSKEIIGHVCSFTERLIDFRTDLPARELKKMHPTHKVFLPKKLFGGELFVKHIKYATQKPLYLTYQVNGSQADALLSPDRDHVIEFQLERILKEIILQFDTVEAIKPILNPSTPHCLEKEMFVYPSDKPEHPQLWREAFHQLYGQKAVLEERNKPNVNSDVQTQGYIVVSNIPYGLHALLLSAGVKSAADVLNYKPCYQFVSLDELTPEQLEVYDLHLEADKIMFGDKLAAEVNLFSHAYDEHGDVTWFKAMSYWDLQGKEKPRINIKVDVLQDRENYLATYGHEAVHVSTQSADLTKGFEKGLTNALGKALSAAIKPKREK